MTKVNGGRVLEAPWPYRR